MKKLLIVTTLLSSFALAAFAADPPKTEEVIVTISQANVCYKATVSESQGRGRIVQAISAQVPCGDKPAAILPVLEGEKSGQKCNYTVGKFLNYSPRHPINIEHKLKLVTRCPTDEK